MSGDAFATPVSTNVFDFSVAPTVGAASSPVVSAFIEGFLSNQP